MLTKLTTQINRIYIRNMIIVASIIVLTLALVFHWISELYLLAFAIMGLLFLLSVKFIENKKILNTAKYLQNFSHIPEAQTFEETLPVYSRSGEKLPHIVLLIHGFSASTGEFRYLLPELEKAGIPYYVPTLSGFGLDNVKKLKNITMHDWLRDVLAAYEIAAQSAEKVSIVAHSMGCMLALYLLKSKNIHKAVFTSPYVRVKKHHQLMKKLLLSSVFCKVVTLINPTVKKNSRQDLEKILTTGRFVYTAVPTESIRALWMLQEFIEPFMQNSREIRVIVGKNDQTIEVAEVINTFSRENGKNLLTLERSGHNILEEEEKSEAITQIVHYLQS